MEQNRQKTKKVRPAAAAKPFPRWMVVLLTAVCTAVGTVAVTLGAMALLLGRNGMAVMEGWMLARWAFVEEDVDLQEVSDAALDSIITTLGDRWSYYLNDTEYMSVLEQRSNQYVGIGVNVDYTDERGLLILSVVPGMPAEKAGLTAGEIITSVEGVDATGGASREAAEFIGGQAGEERTMTILGLDGTEREVTLILESIALEVADGYMTEDYVGVVTLSNFNQNSAEAFKEITDGLVEQGARALVFDVRGNGGGYVAQLTEILDYLLPEGVVFRSDPRWGFEYKSKSDEAHIELPFAVLVDAHSYSAAELFAAELREAAGAYIVGEVTSGKGYSQNTFPLSNGGGIGISTACYFTGDGVSLIGIGITPDEVLSLTDEQEALRGAGRLEPGEDPQLQAALKLLEE